jgi:hypothetical protein
MRHLDPSDGQFHRPSRGGEAPHFVSAFVFACPLLLLLFVLLLVIPQRSGGICFSSLNIVPRFLVLH